MLAARSAEPRHPETKTIKLITTEKAGFIISANIRSNASYGKNLTCSKAGGIARLAGLDVDANGGGGCI